MSIFDKATIECGFKNEEYHKALPDSIFANKERNKYIFDEKHTDLYEALVALMSAFRADNLKEVAKCQREFEILYCYYEEY